MKVKRLYVKQALVSKGYKNSFDSENHSLEYDSVLHAYIIDREVVAHLHNIREVVIEADEAPKQEYVKLEEVTEAPKKKTWSRRKKVDASTT